MGWRFCICGRVVSIREKLREMIQKLFFLPCWLITDALLWEFLRRKEVYGNITYAYKNITESVKIGY
jgi:hypothetical protein